MAIHFAFCHKTNTVILDLADHKVATAENCPSDTRRTGVLNGIDQSLSVYSIQTGSEPKRGLRKFKHIM
jgi:hypothetical protein